jgi:hypothetical protein
MPFEQRDNSGALFTNTKRGDNDKAPAYTGDCLIDGREYRVAAWVKKAKTGRSFMSLAFTPKEEARTAPDKPAPRVARRSSAEMDDEIPF